MVTLIAFPLNRRTRLIREISDELLHIHGTEANACWRGRVIGIVEELRASGLDKAAIRSEILTLSDAVQCELRERCRSMSADGAA